MVKNQEDWLNRKWRPAMGWMYMVVCIADFIVFPIIWVIFQAHIGAKPVQPHEPFTLQGAGLFHMAMGAVLGIAAWSRGREKIAGATVLENQNTDATPGSPPPPTKPVF